MMKFIRDLSRWFAPSPPPPPDPPDDGRRFAWVAAHAYAKPGGQSELVPVILFDLKVSVERREIMFYRTLLPSEYGDSLDELAARYPAPADTKPGN